jgi:hypothetical protein
MDIFYLQIKISQRGLEFELTDCKYKRKVLKIHSGTFLSGIN